MSRGLGKGYLLSLALGKGSILRKGSPACPRKKKGLDVSIGLGKELPSMQLGQLCGSGPFPHDWCQEPIMWKHAAHALAKAAQMEFRAAQHAAGANYVEVAHSHMIGARNQSAACWAAYALEKAACALEKAN